VLLTIGVGPLVMKPPGAQEMRNRWMMHLVHHLQLTADQQTKIQPILNDAEQQIQSVHRDDVTRISAIMQAANGKISVLLNPDQQAELKKMEADRERMFSGHLHGGGMHRPDDSDHPGGPPPGGPPSSPGGPASPPNGP